MLTLAVAVAFTPGVARACSCAYGLDLQWPETNAVDVPRNARVWIGESYAYELERAQLRVAGEATEVPTERSIIETGGGPLHVFTPAAPLAPDTIYELLSCSTPECSEAITRFTTGAASDQVAPAVPVELDRDGGAAGGRNNTCGDSKWASVQLEAEGLIVMEVDNSSLDIETLSGEVAAASLEHEIVVGTGACLEGWPTQAGRVGSVRYAAFDVAGNFSGWSEADSLSIGRGCHCRSDAPAGPAWLLAGLLGLALRRRRRQAR